MIISFALVYFGNRSLIRFMMILMEFGGSIGALLLEFGVKSLNTVYQIIGIILAVIGQSYVIGAFSVIFINLIIHLSIVTPGIIAWPMWIAIYYLIISTPLLALNGISQGSLRGSAQILSLPMTIILSNAIYFVLVLKPILLKHLYGWIPFNYGL